MYQPDQKTLEKYANLLVNFALNGGDGIGEGDVVRISCPEVAKLLYAELNKAVIDAGGHVIGNYKPNVSNEINMKRDFYKRASEEQITHFPEDYYRGLVDTIDHSIAIRGKTDKHALEGIEPEKMMKRSKAMKPYMDWRNEKEAKGEFSWTLAVYPTESAAEEADMSLEEYWREVIQACYLDTDDPIAEWKDMQEKIHEIRDWLNNLEIKKVHVEAENIDLTIKIGDKRVWRGGSGNNIPSYEIFTSPDWRGTEGEIAFNQPLYRYGNRITGIELEFDDGKVTEAHAKQNEELLREMIKTKGANKVGEFSLTDKRFSRIGQFMAETLYDENMGAEHGNTHIALGRAYKDCYDGDQSQLSEDQWEGLGFNDSSVHTDMISTEPRTATATLKDDSKQVIYKNGKFQV